MRRAYEPIPWLASPANAPRVLNTTSLGIGGGISLFSPIPGSGVGRLRLQVGSNPTPTGGVQLSFGVAPPNLFFTCSEGLGTLIVTNNATTLITINWTAQPPPKSVQFIYYEWTVSQ